MSASTSASVVPRPMLARSAVAGTPSQPARTLASPSSRRASGWAQKSPSRTPIWYFWPRICGDLGRVPSLDREGDHAYPARIRCRRSAAPRRRLFRTVRRAAGASRRCSSRDRARAGQPPRGSRTPSPGPRRRAGSGCPPRAGPGRWSTGRRGWRRRRGRSPRRPWSAAWRRRASRRGRRAPRPRTARRACARRAPDSRCPESDRSIGTCGASWAASTAIRAPCRCAIMASSAIGQISPVTLLAPVTLTSTSVWKFTLQRLRQRSIASPGDDGTGRRTGWCQGNRLA